MTVAVDLGPKAKKENTLFLKIKYLNDGRSVIDKVEMCGCD